MNLRDRARTLLKGWTSPPAPEVQFYQVICPEGHALRGQRTAGYQALRCPTCGEGIFVLPRSPFPDPPAPASRTRAPRTVAAVAVEPEPGPIALTDPIPLQDVPGSEPEFDAEVDWLDEVPEGDPSPPEEVRAVVPESVQPPAHDLSGPPAASIYEVEEPRRKPRRAGSGRPPGKPDARVRRGGSPATVSAPSPAPSPVTEVESVPLRERLADWAWRRRNVLLFLGVALLIVATIGIRTWRQRRQDLPRVAALGRVEGLEALDEGKFDKANQLLSEARRAVDALGGAVEGADRIRQGAAEAAIFVNLVPDRLEVILDQAGRYDPVRWTSHFDTLYKGRSIIVDAQIIAVSDVSGQGRYELDYQIFPDGEGKPPRVARIDTAGFRLFENTRPKVGDRVQFGARLASFTYDDRAEEWQVGLEPDSGVFLTHQRALEALGWPSIADMQAAGGGKP